MTPSTSAAPTRPIVTLTTDFGLKDPFVGVMKGVIAGICPSAHVIDISHGIQPFSTLDGALTIWQAWRYFPAETVHTIVVDPGVGSERRAILARLDEHWFIAPDNGVLTLVERDVRRFGGSAQFWQIENPAYRLPKQSNTFHGRDIFAPAAAHLAAQIGCGNVDASSFGTKVENPIQLPVPEPIHRRDGSIEGRVLKSDSFGNLLTNIPAADVPRWDGGWAIEIDGRRIKRFARFFAEAQPGELFIVAGSSGLLEIAMNLGSAQETTGISTGAKVRLVSA